MRSDANWHSTAPQAPHDLTPYARKMWDDFVANAPPTLLATCDLTVLASCCQWGSIAYEQTTFYAHNPLQIDVGQAAAKAVDKFLSLSARVGMSPIDRARLKTPVEKKDDDDPMAVLLKITETA